MTKIKKITQSGPNTDGQIKAIKRLLEDGITSFNLKELATLGFSKDEAQEILGKGDLVQKKITESTIEILREYAIFDNRFRLGVDLGILTVPKNFLPGFQLDPLHDHKYLEDISEEITDEKFSKVSYVLMPGDKLWVRGYYQVEGTEATFEERLVFLSKMNAVFTGAQGIALVFHEARYNLIKHVREYVSMDKKECLWNGETPGLSVDKHQNISFFCYSRLSETKKLERGTMLLCFCLLSKENDQV